MLNFVLAQ